MRHVILVLLLCSFVLALPTQHQAALSWTQSTGTGLTANCVYRAQTSGGPYTQLACPAPSTSYIDTTVLSGQTYFYVVTAVAGTQESAFSNEVKTVIPQSPNSPSGLTAVAQ